MRHVIADRVAVLLAQVNYTIEARWASLVSDTMQAYAMASRFADRPGNEQIAAHLAIVRRKLRRRNGATGKRKKS